VHVVVVRPGARGVEVSVVELAVKLRAPRVRVIMESGEEVEITSAGAS
jgi:hypothetical protein